MNTLKELSNRRFGSLGVENCDVAIIGAGAAGLAAGRALVRQSATVCVVEARDRIGGRALTDHKTFGAPFDRGCTYLHHGSRNPLLKLARSKSVKTVPIQKEEKSKIWVGDREATASEYDEIKKQELAIEAALLAAGRKRYDVSATQAIGHLPPSKWSEMVNSWFEFGCPFDQASVIDWYNNEGGPDFLCPSGLGDLICGLGEHVPVELNTTVLEVHRSAQAVRLVTNRGSISCSYCIVTAPVAVLNAGVIRFVPQLPNWKLEAFAGMISCNYLSIGLQFSDPKLLPVKKNAWFVPWIPDEGQLMFLNNVAGQGICRAETGADAALELLALGERGAISHAVDVLANALGSNVRRQFITGSFTDWQTDPFSRGAWAWTASGQADCRRELARAVDDRLLFAGEACHETMFATCHGAMLSGLSVAKHIISRERAHRRNY